MASSDAQGNNYLPQVVIVTQNAEGANSSNGQSEATQSNSFNIVKGLVSVVFVCIVCGAYYMALMMADRVSVALFPVPPVIIVHALYLIIYAIEKCGFANVSTVDCTLYFVLRFKSKVASCLFYWISFI